MKKMPRYTLAQRVLRIIGLLCITMSVASADGLDVKVEPSTFNVQAGSPIELKVRVALTSGIPVGNADVTLTAVAPTGYFDQSKTTSLTDKTSDAPAKRGTLEAKWQTGDASAYTSDTSVTFKVAATWFVAFTGDAQVTVNIRTGGRSADPRPAPDGQVPADSLAFTTHTAAYILYAGIAAQHGRLYSGSPDPRFNPSYDYHYDWAMRVVNPQTKRPGASFEQLRSATVERMRALSSTTDTGVSAGLLPINVSLTGIWCVNETGGSGADDIVVLSTLCEIRNGKLELVSNRTDGVYYLDSGDKHFSQGGNYRTTEQPRAPKDPVPPENVFLIATIFEEDEVFPVFEGDEEQGVAYRLLTQLDMKGLDSRAIPERVRSRLASEFANTSGLHDTVGQPALITFDYGDLLPFPIGNRAKTIRIRNEDGEGDYKLFYEIQHRL